MYSRQCTAAGAGFTAGNGAVVGLASGLVYGIVTGIVSAVISSVFGVGDIDKIIDELDSVGTMDPQVLEQMNRFMESTGPSVLALIGLFFSIVFGVIFATIGGLIGGAVFKSSAPQPAPVDVSRWPASDQQPPDQPPPPPPVQPAP